jgi:hypothetical protein
VSRLPALSNWMPRYLNWPFLLQLLPSNCDADGRCGTDSFVATTRFRSRCTFWARKYTLQVALLLADPAGTVCDSVIVHDIKCSTYLRIGTITLQMGRSFIIGLSERLMGKKPKLESRAVHV